MPSSSAMSAIPIPASAYARAPLCLRNISAHESNVVSDAEKYMSAEQNKGYAEFQ